MRLCQTMALATGRPVARSQRIVVSRWFVTPIAAMSAAAELGLRERLAGHGELRRPDRLGIVLDVPGEGKICSNSACADGHDVAVAIEDDGAAGSRALVEGEDVFGRHQITGFARCALWRGGP